MLELFRKSRRLTPDERAGFMRAATEAMHGVVMRQVIDAVLTGHRAQPRRCVMKTQPLELAVLAELPGGFFQVDRYTGKGQLQGLPYVISAANVDMLP